MFVTSYATSFEAYFRTKKPGNLTFTAPSHPASRVPLDDGQKINGLKRISGSAHLIHRAMLERPMASPGWIKERTQLSPATVNACLRALDQLGIVKGVTGQKRNRLYSYVEYIRIMNEGTELPQ